MVHDEVLDDAALVGVELHAVEEVLRHARGLFGVVGRVAALAGIVHERGEIEQLGMRQIGQQAAEAALPLEQKIGAAVGQRLDWIAQGVERVDQHEGVLVYGVAVVGVADDESVDAEELGHDELQDAESMHGAQGFAGVGAVQNVAEVVPERGSFFKIGGEQRKRGLKTVFGLGGELAAVLGDGLKEIENDIRIVRGIVFGRGRCVEDDAAVLDMEAFSLHAFVAGGGV